MRKLEINWIRASAEFVVIVVGVLVALGVDSWNQSREDRGTEREYLLRLERDLRADSSMQEFMLIGLAEKTEALDLIAEVLGTDGPPPSDFNPFLNALGWHGNAFGWGFPALRAVTFEDLTDTGNLRLLHDAEVRDSIIGYYRNANHRLNRVSRRHTEYPGMVLRILSPEIISAFPQTDPRAPGGLARGEGASPPIEFDFSRSEATALLARLQGDEFKDALNAERNFAHFATTQVTESLDQVSVLLAFLRAKREGS